jgi:bifunctional UDP-N-acetylglucosamine pyrophosphorylase / glucosamine-1-phosphate N-acetyltransferase
MAAGLGTRMKSATPKHLHPLLGRPLVAWVVAAVRAVGPSPLVLVASPESAVELAAAFPDVEVAVQEEPRGTGDAVTAAREALKGFEGDLLVLAGDSPLLTPEAIEQLVDEHRREGAAVTLLSIEPEGGDRPFGRIVRDEKGDLTAIVEEGDATPEQREIRELNASVYVFSVRDLWSALGDLGTDNAQGELYLTDTIARLVQAGKRAVVFPAPDPEVAEGVNTRADLALAASLLRKRILTAHMLAGVTVVDPETTWIEADVEIEPDAVIQPFTVLRGRTVVRREAEIGPHVVAIDAEIGQGSTVGPFCYLRPGSVLGAGAKAGTFVEIKNAQIGERSKVPHLSYIGDAEIGEDTNIGAGAITANYREERFEEKQRTVIGSNVHTGSQNVFVPPVEIGDDAWTGAGSAITEDVPKGALAVARARQVNKEGYDDARQRND